MLIERLPVLPGLPSRSCRDEANTVGEPSQTSNTGLFHLSEEVLVFILRFLDPFSLLRAGSTCKRLFRICSCSSIWTRHCQALFGVSFRTSPVSPKDAFRLLFMWRKLYQMLPCNRHFQKKLLAEFPPPRYWIQWLVLEERVPLPPVKLPDFEIEYIWGVKKECFDETHKEDSETCTGYIFKYDWKELYHLTLLHHGSFGNLLLHVLNRQNGNDHRELEEMFELYQQFRFQWLFSYWLFRQPKPFDKQLRTIYLQWKKYSKRKVSWWGTALCDVEYLVSLHQITSDYWKGKLAKGDENLGIQTLENYFSMCKSLVAWILGRDWGRLKRRKVYHDTLEGVYRVLKTEMRTSLIDHDHFWQVAKVQMARVCKLEETAVNYVNWKMIDSGPYYRLYLVSGNSIYLEHIKGFLRRKRLISDWFLQDENLWVRHLLSEELCQLLEFDTKILEGSLHGDTLSAHLSRIIWLYLHSGQELYMDAVKGFVLECAGARLKFYSSVNTGFYSSSSSDRECLNTHVELCANEHFLTYG
ncbi:uncharacterized protein si:dkeyp-114g9.1 [Erpetoichthys calabaricus]|uniref:uncharacterized protein si:dkeyp-114g9.1 n=1 Tax=Erpetoichthys calabaricus TaxID=27687 RepID=UPI0022344A79|nr:uncharacterized protein si:dkeyp-114g9.1 [Erpetoichthys calabaricus]